MSSHYTHVFICLLPLHSCLYLSPPITLMYIFISSNYTHVYICLLPLHSCLYLSPPITLMYIFISPHYTHVYIHILPWHWCIYSYPPITLMYIFISSHYTPSWSIKVSIAAQKFAPSCITDWKGSDTTWELRMITLMYIFISSHYTHVCICLLALHSCTFLSRTIKLIHVYMYISHYTHT